MKWIFCIRSEKFINLAWLIWLVCFLGLCAEAKCELFEFLINPPLTRGCWLPELKHVTLVTLWRAGQTRSRRGQTWLCCSSTWSNSTEPTLSSVIIDDAATVVLPLASVADKQEGLEATVGHALGKGSSTLEGKVSQGRHFSCFNWFTPAGGIQDAVFAP